MTSCKKKKKRDYISLSFVQQQIMLFTLQTKNLFSKCNLISTQTNTRTTYARKTVTILQTTQVCSWKLGNISIHAKRDDSQGLNLSNTLFLAHSETKNSTLQRFFGLGFLGFFLGGRGGGEGGHKGGRFILYLCLYTAKYIEQTTIHWPGHKTHCFM